MSNTEARPTEQVICDGPRTAASRPVAADPGTPLELLAPREVPLGGPRAMLVRRALPGRDRRMVGAWCFADTYGPETTRMVVLPHPHTGLQTVSWLLEGRVRHRDSLGSEADVRPGELNLMTAGSGVAHSEVSPPGEAGTLHGAQLWVALPDDARHGAPDFETHADLPRVRHEGAEVTVVLGELLGELSRATVHSPIVGAEIALGARSRTRLPLRPGFEHAVLALTEGVEVGADGLDGGPGDAGGRASPRPTPVPLGAMAYLPPGTATVTVATGNAPARALLLGGEPFEEELVMWWNFVARTHDEVVAARAAWQDERKRRPGERPRFGLVDGHDGVTLPAPDLPNATLRPRPRHRDR